MSSHYFNAHDRTRPLPIDTELWTGSRWVAAVTYPAYDATVNYRMRTGSPAFPSAASADPAAEMLVVDRASKQAAEVVAAAMQTVAGHPIPAHERTALAGYLREALLSETFALGLPDRLRALLTAPLPPLASSAP